MKTHFTDVNSLKPTVCGRTGRVTDNVWSVTCLSCRNTEPFYRAKEQAEIRCEQAFNAQEPRKVHNVWDWQKFYECSGCGGDLWRERDRTLFSYHFVCAGCGDSIHPPTETGMCT